MRRRWTTSPVGSSIACVPQPCMRARTSSIVSQPRMAAPARSPRGTRGGRTVAPSTCSGGQRCGAVARRAELREVGARDAEPRVGEEAALHLAEQTRGETQVRVELGGDVPRGLRPFEAPGERPPLVGSARRSRSRCGRAAARPAPSGARPRSAARSPEPSAEPSSTRRSWSGGRCCAASDSSRTGRCSASLRNGTTTTRRSEPLIVRPPQRVSSAGR